MPSLRLLLFPVSFVLDAGPPRFVALSREDGTPLETEPGADPVQSARAVFRDVLDALGSAGPKETSTEQTELRHLADRFLAVVGAEATGDDVQLICTTSIPVPLAEAGLDITDWSPYTWRTVSRSRGHLSSHAVPQRLSGPDAVVLDYWRQALEESDMALDFLPEHLTLLQLRSLYDAIWGYAQDPSGFKRWAIDRTGAFRGLIEQVADSSTVDESFFGSLGRRLPPDLAARAGAIAAGGLAGGLAPGLRLPIGLAAATAAHKLHHRRGPEPTWFRKTAAWRPGPTWIEHLYPPRPNWTRWEVER